jgi:hypothetical protein
MTDPIVVCSTDNGRTALMERRLSDGSGVFSIWARGATYDMDSQESAVELYELFAKMYRNNKIL